MKLTLLLDLDDTLLVNDINQFLPVYLRHLSGALGHLAPADKLIPALMEATSAMVKNQRPDCRLKEVFDSIFYPALQLNPSDVEEDIASFYSERFPQLQPLTQARPEAVDLVKQALARNYTIVIATNPLFPRTAILQRLEWAGLSPEKYPFSLITSYERLHFAKPRPSFFAEILGHLGWPEHAALMVGDDLENDISGARKLGLPAFWVPKNKSRTNTGGYPPTVRGSLDEVLPWVDSVPEQDLIPDYSGILSMLAVLRSTPAVLDNLCEGISAYWWKNSPEPGEWCPTEVLCHLRDVEREVNIPRLEKVLQGNNPHVPGRDTDPWAEQRQYWSQSGPEALRSFVSARLELLEILEGLNEDAWELPARHAIFGPTNLAEMVGIMAGHDRLHVRQVHETLDRSRE